MLTEYIYVNRRLGGPYSEKAVTYPKPNNFFLFFPQVHWLSSGFIYATLPLNWLTCRLQTIAKNLTSERASITQILDKERCIKEQIHFELLHASCI